jgi:anaerobic selenocysteine-containing dehydrogenase
VSKGSLCIRGWNSVDAWRHPDRLAHPLVREGESLQPASAEQALDRICGHLKDAPPGSVCFAVAPSVSNEDVLGIRQLARHLRARVCGADFSGVPTGRRALEKVLGRHYCLSSLSALEQAGLIWVFGADLENYPQVASALTQAEANGARVVCFDVFSQAEKASRQQVSVPPEEFLLLSLLLQKCALDLPAVASRPGFAELMAQYREASWFPSSSNIQEPGVRELVKSFAACPGSAVVIGDRWLTTGSRPLEQTAQLVQAVALLGAENRLVIAAGEVNSWGLADLLPPLESDSRLLAGLLNGDASDISVLVVCGDDLLRSVPCAGNLEDALGVIGRVIVLDRFRSELFPFADVVLPEACFAELDGTVTSAFGMVQRWRQIVAPPVEARPERAWLGLVASRLGMKSWPQTPLAWWTADCGVPPPYDVSGLRSLYESDSSAAWFWREETHLALCSPSGPLASRAPGDQSVQAVFTRHPTNWRTGAWSNRDQILRRESPEQVLSVAAADLEEKGIRSGGRVRLVTQEGSVVFPARADSRLPRGVVSLAEVPGSRDIPRSIVADSEEGFSFQPVPCRLEKV